MKKEVLIVFFMFCFSLINSTHSMDVKKEKYIRKMNVTHKICYGLNFLNSIDTPIHRIKAAPLFFRMAMTSFALFASSNEDVIEIINNEIG